MSTLPIALEREAQITETCYHCGQPVPAGVDYRVAIGDKSQPMCCVGCEAVARSIVDSGLADYYAKRDNYADSPREPLPNAVGDLQVYDRPELQTQFVAVPSEHEREVTLILEGISCPACIWLNETHLARQPGVIAVNINYTTRRARVRWDSRGTSLSAILDSIRRIGYLAYPYDAKSLEAVQKREARSLLARFAIAGLGMMQVMMYAVPAYIDGEATITRDLDLLMRWASFVLTAPVVFYSAAGFFRSAWRDLAALRVGMDVPVALAIAAAFAASTHATLTGAGAVYFDSVTMFVFLLLGVRYLELRARQKAATHLEALSRAAPAVAHKLINFPLCMNTEITSAGALHAGDFVLVRPGQLFPADGRVEQGETDSDESLLSGESMPVRKTEGASVVAGAMNRANPVVVRVDRVGEQTVLSAIVRLIERAAQSRPRLQEVTDRVAAHFVAAVLIIALATAMWWMWHDSDRALPIVIAVLVVTCPCALSLATPMALAVATSDAARHGLLITRGHALETLARATHFVLDKTGTLTRGRPVLQKVRVIRDSKAEAIASAAALELGSEHPFARAIVEAAHVAPMAKALRNHPGSGIEGTIGGRRLRIGTAGFVAEMAPVHSDIDNRDDEVWLADEKGAIATFQFADSLRPDAKSFVNAVNAQGATVILLSGDRESTVRETAAQLGIEQWHAAMSPADKKAFVEQLQERSAVVAMVGDGVNDAPVIAQAQVSIAMMSGAALAQGAADMVLLSGRLSDLGEGIAYARRTLRTVRQNLGWAIAYNAVALPLAIAGFVTPWLAAVGMSASSILVVLNALRLLRHKRRHCLALIGD